MNNINKFIGHILLIILLFCTTFSETSLATTRKRPLVLSEDDPSLLRITKKHKVETADDSVMLRRISTVDQHIAELRSALKLAKKEVLITTYGVNGDTLKRSGLYELIPQAVERGVNVYVYDNWTRGIDPAIIRFFETNRVRYQQTITHAKILSYDKQYIAIGSCNWLSMVNSRYPDSLYSSTLYTERDFDEGEELHLAGVLWGHLMNYQRRFHHHDRKVRRFESRWYNNIGIEYPLTDESELVYLPTLHMHREFIKRMFDEARNRLIVCSNYPLVANLRDDFSKIKIGGALSRGVEVIFVCKTRAPGLPEFERYLGRLFNWPKLHLLDFSDIHTLTVIVDNNIYVDSSFNWLSATRDRESEYHNHEASLVTIGKKGERLINDFFYSEFGKRILSRLQ